MITSTPGPPYWFVVALTGLVPLDRRVLHLAAGGRSYRQIATEVGVSVETVRHRAHTAMTALLPPR